MLKSHQLILLITGIVFFCFNASSQNTSYVLNKPKIETILKEPADWAMKSGKSYILDSLLIRSHSSSSGFYEDVEINRLDYNSNNQVTRITTFSPDIVTGQWIENRQYQYTYNSYGLTQTMVFDYNEEIEMWDYDLKDTRSYHPDGLLAEVSEYSFDDVSGSWTCTDRETYEYNDQSLEETKVIYEFNNSLDTLLCQSKHEYVYDTSENLILETTFNWSESEHKFIPDAKDTITYNTNNFQLSEINYLMNQDSLWQKNHKTEYYYNTNLNLTSYINYSHNTGEWTPIEKYDYFYDNGHNQISRVFYEWNITDMTWMASLKTDAEYDEYGNQTKRIDYEYYDSETETWLPYIKYSRNYNTDATILETVIPETISYYFWFSYFGFLNVQNSQPVTTETYEWDEAENSWEEQIQINYYYSQIESGIPSLKENAVLLYPNPAFNYVYISAEAEMQYVYMINNTGQILLGESIQAKVGNLNVSKLPAGQYSLKLIFKNGDTENRQVIVQ